jgi:hypothetical protein
MGSPQLNVRLSREAADALEAAVFVRSLRSAQDLVGPAVEELAASLAQDPDIAAAIALRLRHRRQEQSNVTAMRPSGTKRGSRVPNNEDASQLP